MRQTNNPFWSFSLETYAKPGVAEACLALQDKYGLDVNLLLFCCWAARNGRRLSQEDLERLDGLSSPWRRHVVLPLRELRRWLKTREVDEQVTRFRAAIKRQELEAERLQQDQLHAVLPLDVSVADCSWLTLAEANLRQYLEFSACPTVNLDPLLQSLG
ncbi:TIGR02444 family protein [Limibacillus halophilus]|uniref:Uncharacterized protein (TIGR02444 family) n=1 Tax=Limibacillus halophilus TaxID=1579333 RepID=A0A839T0H9_9PROT|nr:TIGR02444 family protein [Limibacillus halophilus]MBB3066845.1 uncharacterized protein (TIGR02444 family) [Limibacillus halophilus]